MLDPFTYWSRAMSAYAVTERTGRQLVQTATASERVISARTQLAAQDSWTPGTGAQREASRMVPEKLAAAAASGQAFVAGWSTLQSEVLAQGARAAGLIGKGRPPTLLEVAEFWSASAMSALRLFEGSAGVGRDVLKPYHQTATANAKRLRGS